MQRWRQRGHRLIIQIELPRGLERQLGHLFIVGFLRDQLGILRNDFCARRRGINLIEHGLGATGVGRCRRRRLNNVALIWRRCCGRRRGIKPRLNAPNLRRTPLHGRIATRAFGHWHPSDGNHIGFAPQAIADVLGETVWQPQAWMRSGHARQACNVQPRIAPDLGLLYRWGCRCL
ncbi:hypothetical protein SDC9_66872 [bioreactor metagenome]|uniref:Uncharacterized protein n=1 Tax=bioreactor metagenome TaxID=1076179 RepID=A0A644XW21_9ZZZZ